MPLYEFKCRACGHRFEELVRLGETPECPKCGMTQHRSACSRLRRASARIAAASAPRASRGAKQAKVKREKDHAQREYERNYIKEHSEGG